MKVGGVYVAELWGEKKGHVLQKILKHKRHGCSSDTWIDRPMRFQNGPDARSIKVCHLDSVGEIYSSKNYWENWGNNQNGWKLDYAPHSTYRISLYYVFHLLRKWNTSNKCYTKHKIYAK